MRYRYLLLSSIALVLGYVAGVLFGYRSAVVDYVENDAQTIEKMADSMYDGTSVEDLPDDVQEAIAESEPTRRGDDDESGGSTARRGFQ